MSIKYTRREFLEHFDDEIMVDEEGGLVKYVLKDTAELLLTVYVSIYEKFVAIALYHPHYSRSLFDVGIKGVQRLLLRNEKNGEVYLDCLKGEHEENLILSVLLKPSIQLSFDINV